MLRTLTLGRLTAKSNRRVIMAEEIDRSVLPIRRQTFAGEVNRTLAGSQPDWQILSGPRAPDGAPNVLLVLIDDAGSGTRARSAARCRRRI